MAGFCILDMSPQFSNNEIFGLNSKALHHQLQVYEYLEIINSTAFYYGVKSDAGDGWRVRKDESR